MQTSKRFEVGSGISVLHHKVRRERGRTEGEWEGGEVEGERGRGGEGREEGKRERRRNIPR